MVTRENNADEALRDQEMDEELVEIDEEGNIHKPNQAPRRFERKPTILRDPQGEF